MEEKLYISEEAIEKYSLVYFEGMEADDFRYEADDDPKELEDGLLMYRDDMGNIYLSANECDERFNDIEDLKDNIYILSHEKVFNMAEICRRASVDYQQYKNWKSKGCYGLSDYKIERLVEEMKNAHE